MRVVTLTPPLLSDACHQLSQRVLAAGCHPSLIIGVQSGGAEVSRRMRPDFADVPYAEVRISRPSTRQKEQGLTHRLLRLMPLWLCDVLRIAESKVGEWRSHSAVPQRIGQLALEAEVPAGSTILVIDDAIDTGATLQTLTQYLAERYPQAIVRIAVITVTTSSPVCDAHFALYRDHTLCRFPWSNDYR